MSLRLRLVLLFAALAAVATGLCSTAAYVATSQRFTSEVDTSVISAAGYLTSHQGLYQPGNPGGQGQQGGTTAKPPAGTTTTTLAPLDVDGDRNGPGGPLGPDGPGGVLDQVAVQRLDQQGTAADYHTGPTIPITAIDVAIARGTAPNALRTEVIDGTEYRVATVAIPSGGAFQVAQSLTQRNDVLDQLRDLFILLALLVTTLGAFAGLVVATRLTRPLEALTLATEELAETGASTQRLQVDRADEVGRLSRSFVEMLAALETSKDQQHQLVRDAGHELRTPITSLRTNIELLERHDATLTSSQRAQLLENLGGELEELTELVNEIVDLATEQAEDEAAEELDLLELCHRVAEQARRRFARQVGVEGESWTVEGRPRALERAVANLVANAAKFSPPHTPITIRCTPPELSVSDEGPGIAEHDLRRIFDRFYRAESSKGLPGSGLGLSIVASVAEAHGASVFAQNHDGPGVTIGMRLPS